MKILYFAWLRTKTGTAQEEIDLPGDVTDVGGLIEYLKTRGPGHAQALADLSAVRVAVNQEYARLDHPLTGDEEVALFPPVTGG